MGIKAGFRASIVGLLTATAIAGGMVAGAGTASACAENPYSHELAASLPQLRPGTTGTATVGLQVALRDHGHKLQGTGFYGPNTLAAVRAFQRKNGIKDSGIVGSKTWQALVGRLSVYSTGGRSNPTFAVHPGETDVKKVNHLRDYLSRLDFGGEQFWDEKSYSPRMVATVKRFQQSVGIKASGIVGPKTWTAMNQVLRIAGHWGC
ncbi:N-acetylmuramoyl-L-alanine amidase [Alloactinosynnema sp. L-07]|uniref:peptidoglycan-binding domain-containing protein n=1 Tax=Alloactinosynnema sp. L-07 TaxID=1653480 RepID=UPI00065EF4D6|nr:peptidoglycan-binding protein [Alloactinosynnema sp. L-07]CRK60412.1 N-acetylmuramoyl-L-alanine amidase [Alloactinosynnema sp. L-07]